MRFPQFTASRILKKGQQSVHEFIGGNTQRSLNRFAFPPLSGILYCFMFKVVYHKPKPKTEIAGRYAEYVKIYV